MTNAEFKIYQKLCEMVEELKTLPRTIMAFRSAQNVLSDSQPEEAPQEKPQEEQK